jgi:cell wall-associated NlpC family hydrolase
LQLKSQQIIISEAQKHLGVAYLTAGSDPAGFDCSGFTSYVFAKAGYQLPRRAADQFAEIQKIEAQDAQLGDLVFFSNGGEVNHVGILINEKGSAKQMIHASSSKGISIADIEATNYWKTRVVGFGRVINP